MGRKYIFYPLVLALLFAACRPIDDSEEVSIVELAANAGELIVNDGGGMSVLAVYSSGTADVKIKGEAPDWIELEGSRIKGDGEVKLYLDPNPGYLRMVTLEISLRDSDRKITVPVKQKGLSQYLSCAEPYKVADGRTDDVLDFALDTNVPLENLSCSIEYLGLYKDWISSSDISGGVLRIGTVANATDICRRAKCTVTYVDGWNRESSMDLFITQSDREGSIGKTTGVALIKALGTPEGTVIEDDFVLEGVVVSDCGSANMALNPTVAAVNVDTTFARRVAYMQGEDGSWGIRLVFDSESDNSLHFGTKVAMSLYGATVVRESDPERYTISGLAGWNIASSEAGAAVPDKQRTIEGLTDDDIYTYVSLQNTEFAFKRGSYADVLESYALKSAVNANVTSEASQLDGWASLLIDGSGHGIYAPVNMLCLWRRSGHGVPQGTGPTRGIIVHEDLERLGDAGRYQIRVIDESGFAQGEESDLQEFAYWINSYRNRDSYAAVNSRYTYKKLATVIPSNDLLDGGKLVANAEMVSENIVIPASRTADPYTTANYYNDLTAGNSGISTQYVGIGDITTTHDWYKWSEEGEFEGYNGFVFSFSTSNLQANSLEFAFDFAGGYLSAATARSWPAHWCVEYSVDGGDSWTLVPNCVNGKPYVHMRGLPWVKAFLNGQWYYTAAQAGMGFSQHSFTLPSEVLGKDAVLLKLRPYDRVITSLPLVWDDDIEKSEIDYTTDVDIRIRFGFIYLRYR